MTPPNRRDAVRAALAVQLLAASGAAADMPAADTAGWVAHRPQAGGYRVLAPPAWVKRPLPRSGTHALVLQSPDAAAGGQAMCNVVRRGDPALAGLSAEAAAARRLDEASLRAALGELDRGGELRELAPVAAAGRTVQHAVYASILATAAASVAFRGEALFVPAPDWIYVVNCRVGAPDPAQAEASFVAWRPVFQAMMRSFTFE
jgi:hypothetical protein